METNRANDSGAGRADFPNRLTTTRTAPTPVALRPSLLALLLLLLCFAPRAMMAWRVDTLCPDGVLYLRLAEQLEQGVSDPSDTGGLQASTLPAALAALHRLGLDWETAARWYGVALASLVVLPMFGWVRRQFDDRVAVVACILYAVHPKLIEWSPEAVREPSFWFFLSVALYALWRGAADVDWRWYGVGGAFSAAAALTRFEGLFLVFPLAGWTALRWSSVPASRARLAIGALLFAAAFGGVVGSLHAVQPAGSNRWGPLRVEPLARAGQWLASWTRTDAQAPQAAAPVDSALPPAQVAAAQVSAPMAAPPGAWAAPSRDWTFAQAAWQFVHTLERGLTPIFGLLMFGGYFAWFRLLNRSDSLPILLLVLAVAAGIWIHLSYAHVISSRYALTIAVVSTRSASLGLLSLAAAVGRLRFLHWPAVSASRAALAALLVIAGLVGCIDAVSSDQSSRQSLANLGRWIQGKYGAHRGVVGSEGQLAVVGYYARTTPGSFPPGLAGDDLLHWVEQAQPDVVILSQRKQLPADYRVLVERRAEIGLEIVDPATIPGRVQRTLVLARVRAPGANTKHAARPIPTG